MNVIDPYLKFFKGITLIANKIDQNKLLELSIGNLIKVIGSINSISQHEKYIFYTEYDLNINLIDFTVCEVGKVCIINEHFESYDCYLNEVNMQTTIEGGWDESEKHPSYRSDHPYTFYIFNKDSYVIKLKQQSGYLLYPTTFKRKIKFFEYGQEFTWNVPKN